jgi:hypothetical protein
MTAMPRYQSGDVFHQIGNDGEIAANPAANRARSDSCLEEAAAADHLLRANSFNILISCSIRIEAESAVIAIASCVDY